MLGVIYLGEALRMFKRSLSVRSRGVLRYAGSADDICRSIIRDCWTGEYYMTSTGHFSQFWVRDFAFCVEALMDEQDKVEKTLGFALDRFSKYGRTATTLTKSGVPFDVFAYSPDTLPLLLFSLRVCGSDALVKSHKLFLSEEVSRYADTVIDMKTGLVRKDRHFSSAKDNARRVSSLYDNVMAAVLSRECDELGLPNPLKGFDHEHIITENFWRGDHFSDDLSGSSYISGDANVIPFWSGVFKPGKRLALCIKKIQSEGLDMPFPLKYTKSKIKGQYMGLLSMLVSNYEGNSIWAQWGPMYIREVAKHDRKLAVSYLRRYRDLIEKHGTYLEVYNPDGSVFRTPFYHSDEGMIWCANYLKLSEELL